MWLKAIGATIALFGVIFIYDSRRIAKQKLNFGDENTTTLGLKIFGAILTVVGGLLCII